MRDENAINRDDGEMSEELKHGAVLTLPVVPLRELVVFPHLVVPLMLARTAGMRAVRRAMSRNAQVLLLSQVDGAIDSPSVTDFYEVGAVARVLQIFRVNENTHKVIVEAVGRGRARRINYARGEYKAQVEVISQPSSSSAETEALMRTVRGQFMTYASATMTVPDNVTELVEILETPDQLSDTVAAYISLGTEVKQELLAEPEANERLRRLASLLEHELKVLEIQRDITDRVRGRIQKSQKDLFLREQLRAIEEELGRNDPSASQYKELLAAIEASGMPQAAMIVAHKELEKLRRTAPMTPQFGVIEEYLRWLTNLPWDKRTEDNLDLAHARQVLDAHHFGLEEPKERILEYLAVKSLTGDTQREPILCLVGPPGVGKTSLARSVAESLGRQFVRKSLGGVRDEAEIRGHRRTYVGAMPGRIIQSISRAGSRNPVFLLDEIDKMSADFRGDPASALLEVLDPDENHSFSDHYLEVEFDLSDVLFITTANLGSAIPAVLRDRMEVIELSSYTLEEKQEIARRHLLPRQLRAHGLTRKTFNLTPSAMVRVAERYTNEAGVRNLNKRLADICRKAATRIAEAGGKSAAAKVRVTAANLADFLGPEIYKDEVHDRRNLIGAATGLAWTEAGGRIMTVEVSWMRGKGRTTLTGQLGEVMQESAQAAVTFARSSAEMLGLDSRLFETIDLHIHVPEGATPKDGPSAGVALTAAVVSCLTGKAVRGDVATTGEITLRGRVLPIGGLKEKVLAARRNGIRELVVPEGNRGDLRKIAPEIVEEMTFHFVGNVLDALRILVPAALEGRPKGGGRQLAAHLPPVGARPPAAVDLPDSPPQ